MYFLNSDLNNKILFFNNNLNNCYKKLIIEIYLNINIYRKNISNIYLEKYLIFFLLFGYFPKMTKIFFKKSKVWRTRKKSRNKSIGLYLHIFFRKVQDIVYYTSFLMPLFKNKIKKSRKSIIGSLILLNKKNLITTNFFGVNYFVKPISLEKKSGFDLKTYFLLEFSESIKFYYIFKFENNYSLISSYFNLFK